MVIEGRLLRQLNSFILFLPITYTWIRCYTVFTLGKEDYIIGKYF